MNWRIWQWVEQIFSDGDLKSINDISLHFSFGLIHSLFHFTCGVLNTQNWRESDNLSTLYSSLQTTYSNSLAVQCYHFKTQANCGAACLSFKNVYFFILHFLIPTPFQSSATFNIEVFGQLLTHNSHCVMVRLPLAVYTKFRLYWPFSFSGFLEHGRFLESSPLLHVLCS